MYQSAVALCERNANWARASITWLALGTLALDLGNNKGAEYCHRHALRGMVPGKIGAAAVGLAEAKVQMGAWQDAAALLGAIMTLPPNTLMQVIWNRAEAALERLRNTVPATELDPTLESGRTITLEAVVERWAL